MDDDDDDDDDEDEDEDEDETAEEAPHTEKSAEVDPDVAAEFDDKGALKRRRD